MIEKAWYKDWFNSPFYYKLYFERDQKEANEFINNLINYLKPPPGSKMLDVACGRGRYSRTLVSKGFYVTGIDISASSIEFANQSIQNDFNNDFDRLEFYLHDMRLPFRVNYYDYVFNFFTSLGYFNTKRENDNSIRTIANSLKKNGIFVIDYLNVHYAEEHLIHNENKIIDGTEYDIHRWHDDNYFYKKITVNDPLLHYPIEHTERVAKFNLGDFTDMLSFQHMQVHEVFGDYNLGSYHVRNKPRLIIVAKKL